ncbi:MAG: ABC transporter ATP-binding protein [Smithellaceae bacterium]|nr:ABC transporter ATP-binding protein [Smithellaceae bacterium]
MIELFGLTKNYNGFQAVEGLNLQVAQGEIFGFIGPNGAGKTTTIKMITGLLKPSAGRVCICGLDMAVNPEGAKGRIGFIPDRPYLYEKLTGQEFLMFCADLHSIPAEIAEPRTVALLDKFSLRAWGDELIESYSHGMKQRLIIAAALLHEPQVIVVDEPMVGLDPAGIRLVKELFREKARGGVTLFISTHILEIAEGLCDRIGVIHQGRLIALGTAAQLREKAELREGDLEEVFLHLTGRELS